MIRQFYADWKLDFLISDEVETQADRSGIGISYMASGKIIVLVETCTKN